MVGHRIKLRGHYNPTNKSRKQLNIQSAITPEGKKIWACARCIRTFSKKSVAV